LSGAQSDVVARLALAWEGREASRLLSIAEVGRRCAADVLLDDAGARGSACVAFLAGREDAERILDTVDAAVARGAGVPVHQRYVDALNAAIAAVQAAVAAVDSADAALAAMQASSADRR